MQAVYYFVLVPMVYVALAVFICGTIWQGGRILIGLRRSLSSAVGPERPPKLRGAVYETFLFPIVLRNHPLQWVLLMAFHATLLLLILGHIELVGDVAILQVIEHRVFLGGGAVGLILLVVLLFFLFRRFHSPLREISVPGDYYLLILFFLVVLFGSELHLARRLFDYSTIGVDEYREYLSSLFMFRPALPEVFTEDYVGHSFLLVLHVFFANLFLMLFPTSRMMHALLAFPLARLKRR
ncbi:MAG: respiratory nitrate reductase subunit gamma [Planctomycetes bacterium]|nr:respiratory nitrate reductase subunit gamma [Planctomycetota bacterium]